MTLNQTFENWEIQSDRTDEKLYFVNNNTGNEVELQKDGTMKSPAVTTEEEDITNETLVLLDGDSAVPGVTAGNYSSPDWKTIKDERGEISGNKFTPDKSGWYWISAYVEISNPSDGDEMIPRFHNVTDDSSVEFGPSMFANGTGEQGVSPFVRLAELDSGDSYEYQVTNKDSQFEISAGQCGMAIRSAFRES
jgi:hypothetical protein